MPCKQSDILTVYQTQFFAKLHKQNWLHFKTFIEHWKQRIELQWRLFSSWCYWQSFFCNQWAIQQINQVVNRFANQSMIKQQIKQSNNWNRMHCFLYWAQFINATKHTTPFEWLHIWISTDFHKTASKQTRISEISNINSSTTSYWTQFSVISNINFSSTSKQTQTSADFWA